MGKIIKEIRSKLFNFAEDYKYPLIIFITSRLVIFLTVYLTNKYNLGTGTLFEWDAQQYVSIASNGYIFHGLYTGVGSYIAFFPLYPIIVRLLSFFIPFNIIISALIVSFIFGTASALLLYKLVRDWGGEKVGINSVFLFSFFPMSVFLTAPYTESLFLFLVLSFFLAIGKKKWLPSAVLISLALVTRITGFVLIPIYIYELYKNKVSIFNFITYLILTIVPFGLFTYFQYVNYKTPFAFLVAQKINWYHEATYPWVGLRNIIGYLGKDTMYVVDFFFLILMLVTLILSFKKINKNILYFGWGVVLLSLSQTFILGLSRYMIMVIPFYFLWGRFLEKRTLLGQLIFAIFSSWMIFNTILFILHKHIF